MRIISLFLAILVALPAMADNTSVLATLPDNAKVKINSIDTITTGPLRLYEIASGKESIFEITAVVEGQETTWEETVIGKDGERIELNWTKPKLKLIFGVQEDKLDKKFTTHNGKPISTAEAINLLATEGIPNDGENPFITIIGTDEERASVLAELNKSPAFQAVKDRYRIQDYSPDQWPIKDMGFATSGHPTIYIQSAQGKVKSRSDSFPGADKLVSALRKADPLYKAENDPDLTQPASIASILKDVSPVAMVSILLIPILFLFAKKKA